MKLLTLLSVLIISSCTKEQPIKKAFKSRIGHDLNTWSAAMFCFPNDYIGDDTIVLSYSEYDGPSLLGYFSRKPSGDLYNRYYWYVQLKDTIPLNLTEAQMNYYIQKQKQYK